MTREEALVKVKGYLTDYLSLEDADEIDEIIEALKQQPCEDCISREKVRRLICKNNDKYGYSNRFHEFTEECLKLPSVTPTRLPGHWITNSDYPDKLICSECNSKFDMWWMDKGSNYCPNCEADMRESEG